MTGAQKIYTRSGDRGTTSLGSGERVSKDHERIEAYGTIDELNCTLGLWVSEVALRCGEDERWSSILSTARTIQHRLFDLGAELSDPGQKYFQPTLDETDIAHLESSMDTMSKNLPPLTAFILPGGHPFNALAHLARTICRRAERTCVRLEQKARDEVVGYLNRLSDWLFVAARYSSHLLEADEVRWKAKSTDHAKELG